MTVAKNVRGPFFVAIVAGIALSIFAPLPSLRADSSVSGDGALLAALQAAADGKLAPDAAIARAGRPPAIDTRKKDHWDILHHALIVPDDEARGAALEFPTTKFKTVMYWVRDIKAHNAPIVGLAWSRDGTVARFVGFVLPP